jgi:hypothetical protein
MLVYTINPEGVFPIEASGFAVGALLLPTQSVKLAS